MRRAGCPSELMYSSCGFCSAATLLACLLMQCSSSVDLHDAPRISTHTQLRFLARKGFTDYVGLQRSHMYIIIPMSACLRLLVKQSMYLPDPEQPAGVGGCAAGAAALRARSASASALTSRIASRSSALACNRQRRLSRHGCAD